MRPKGLWVFVAILAAAAAAQHAVTRKATALRPPDRAAKVVGDALKRHYLPLFEEGLRADQKKIQPRELDQMVLLNHQPGRSLVVYLNRYGEVRWHRDPTLIGRSFDELRAKQADLTDALERAYVAGEPRSRPLPGGEFDEVAVPVVSGGEVLGIVVLRVDLPKTTRVL